MEDDPPQGAVLTGAEIRRLLGTARPLIRGVADPDRQVQPNGIDLTLESVWRQTGRGRISVEECERVLAPRDELAADAEGYYELTVGPHVARLKEVVDLPTDLMALGRPRSSLLRCGVAVHTAVWDAGYSGRSEVLLVVYNPFGFRIRCGAPFLQLVFLRLEEATTPYGGEFHGEHLA